MPNPVLQLLLALLLAHLLVDFALQRDADIEKKHRLRISAFAQHSLFHALLAYLICGLWTLWEVPLAVFVSHLVIDLVKEGVARWTDPKPPSASAPEPLAIASEPARDAPAAPPADPPAPAPKPSQLLQFVGDQLLHFA